MKVRHSSGLEVVVDSFFDLLGKYEKQGYGWIDLR